MLYALLYAVFSHFFRCNVVGQLLGIGYMFLLSSAFSQTSSCYEMLGWVQDGGPANVGVKLRLP